jgi:inorganic pyrophosphatase
VPVGGEPINTRGQGRRHAGGRPLPLHVDCAIRKLGFIPHTLSGDGDPCDVLVANTRAIVPGAVMSVRPVGVC